MECLTLKKSNCKNCYKCIRHCPVKSIRFSGNQAYIIGDECIMCGQCFVVCPQNAKQIVDETEKVKVLLQSGAPVVVSLAPSFVANYEVGIEAMREAIKKLGFYDVEETAIGATIVKREYERLVKDEERDIIITSCCHSVNLLIQKHFPRCLPYLADIMSPMQVHCKDIKKRIPNAKTVFIGPCVAKKDEAQQYKGIVDAVLTFDELTAWLKAENITLEKKTDSNENSRARFFPTTGGILKTMDKKNPKYVYMSIDGAENCIAALRDIEKGNLHHCFIEMSACAGSCIGGPVMEKHHRSPVRDFAVISRYAGKKDFLVEQPSRAEIRKDFEIIEQRLREPTEEEILDTLRQMGKMKPSDELNCGSCGYNTCREKAIAICQGKAEISMCLPFLKEKAENFSDTIARNIPNGLIVLNEKLEVQQINNAALKILNLRRASDILGDQIVRVLDPGDFLTVLTEGTGIRDKREYLAEYKKYVEKTIIYDKEYRQILCILRDVTEEENQRARKESITHQTIEIADKVVDKQMRIVQEIASLLGETVAETKIALTKLKESITNE
ncbi:[Fe-Fe] hydrogenase large subunit C-terminal domain-containing protein [Thermoclostridium caenicola]|uniref:Iron only hydrogenase large subunit, C-terminal domain n=1 Tax=Thermoclostridium caenicola TaxID=659425 RepID=A0A1M6I2M1_9FIRM|nr:[Fe-Fe] hydrogenase large subunit C-terminal domain-containing protein [Thermoclostridium caenicola]SHJ28733.1 Iron only hydrogenase large subunit, C-terminal domain [Thermoclostridium caenicola]